MNVYISGITGTGMGPLALMAKAAGINVFGSDLAQGAIYDELKKAGIEVLIGEQDGEFLRKKMIDGVDWFVYTSALPANHPELVMAQEAGVKCTKRDDFTAFLMEKLGLKMIAVAGTHGKTTTTAMIVWTSLKLELPVSYIVGTTLGFAPSGAYHEGDKYFVYEADEYDRNFLKYHPWLAVIPSVSYDHPDIYPTVQDYEKAFSQFKAQSENVLEYDGSEILYNGENDGCMFREGDFGLAGKARRIDAALAGNAIYCMEEDVGGLSESYDAYGVRKILDGFPGVGRRFERLADGLYTDYAHHPEEITATIDVAKDECKLRHKKGIVVIYQPHQNVRQHEVRDGYKDAFVGVEKVYWLPTYLTREDPELRVITPKEFISDLSNNEVAEAIELGDELAGLVKKHLDDGYLVLLLTAGPADEWVRQLAERN